MSYLKTELEKKHASASIALGFWLKEVEKNPVQHLSLGDASLLHSARVHVFGSVLKHFESRTQEEWARYAKNIVMREALDPASSTSAMSNLMAKMTAKAWAEIVEMCEESE